MRVRRSSHRFATVAGFGLLAAFLAGCSQPEAGPFAVFSLDPASGPSPLVVRFDASASYVPDGQIVDFRWSFGDGETGTGRTPAHTYRSDEERTLSVTLTVTDNQGAQASASDSVTVLPPEDGPTSPEVGFVWPFHFDAAGDDAANLNDEYFTVQNEGTEAVDLSGWSVSNERGETFVFPTGFTLAAGALVTVHSGSGSDSTYVLYWNAGAPMWNDTTDIAFLQDAEGDVIDVYAYASC